MTQPVRSLNECYAELQSIYDQITLYRHLAESQCDSAYAGFINDPDGTHLSVMGALNTCLKECQARMRDALEDVQRQLPDEAA